MTIDPAAPVEERYEKEAKMQSLLAFGEILLRLSPPGRQLLMQASQLDVWVAGAEANVASQLARLGHRVAFASRVPDNDLGHSAAAALRGYGVDVEGIEFAGERMGLYFVAAGAGLRPTNVIYDRAASSFACAPPQTWDWDELLKDVDRLHLSGITPALGDAPAKHAIAAAEAAAARGISVSFDGNWRSALWSLWDAKPRWILTEIVRHVDILFGNHRDVALLLGQENFEGRGESRSRLAAEAAFEAFPKLQIIASTDRKMESVDVNRLSGRIDTRDDHCQTDEIAISGIVDRIGGGDAFTAGVLHGLRSNGEIDVAAHYGLALAALKHSLPGDASLFLQKDIDAFLQGELDVRR